MVERDSSTACASGRRRGLPNRLNDLLAQNAARPRRTLLVRDAGRTVVIPHDDIVWIEAEDYCARLHLRTRSVLVRESLKALGDQLPAADFVRVHRSAIANVAAIRSLEPAQPLAISAYKPGRRHHAESQPHAPRHSARGAGPAPVNARAADELPPAPMKRGLPHSRHFVTIDASDGHTLSPNVDRLFRVGQAPFLGCRVRFRGPRSLYSALQRRPLDKETPRMCDEHYERT